ncbi:MAG: hypothetical protein HC905_12200 [Bacteroidales bacterium]|nr:hypothetical protein [Bacteroidales bacterium]
MHNSGVPSSYFFNGFSNYTFSLSFVNPQDGNQKGTIQGFRYDGGVSSLLPFSGNNYAFTRFYYTDEYFLTFQTISTYGNQQYKRL